MPTAKGKGLPFIIFLIWAGVLMPKPISIIAKNHFFIELNIIRDKGRLNLEFLQNFYFKKQPVEIQFQRVAKIQILKLLFLVRDHFL